MRNNNYLSVNYFLSIIGIHFSYFYFGTQNYFYPQYLISEIFKSAIIITAFFSLAMLLTKSVIKSFFPKVILNFFQSILFGAIFFFIYFFIFRFSDLNYENIYLTYFTDQNILFKLSYYSFPFIIPFFVSFFLNESYIYKINKFLFILLIILNFLSVIRIYQLYNNDEITFNPRNDYKNFQVENVDNHKIKKKVIFIIFDEFDQFYFEKNLKHLDNLKKLYKTSFVNKNFFTPAMFTLDSIPAILTGNSIQKKFFKKNNLYFYNLENQLVQFNFENSIFNQKKYKNFSSSIYGVYHPYCRTFIVQNCYDSINFSMKKISVKNSFQYFFDVTYLDKLYSLYKKKSNRHLKKKKLKDNLLSRIMFENSTNFINSNTDLVYIHYDYPHTPLKIKELITLDKEFKDLSDYEKNLFLVDETIANIEKTINNHKNSLLIITTDHWFKNRSDDKAYPGVFFSKIIGDNNYHEGKKNNNASSIKDLIDKYYDGSILNNNDIKLFFDNEKNHEIFIR